MLLNCTPPKVVSYMPFIFLFTSYLRQKQERLSPFFRTFVQIVLCITSTNEETKKNYCELRHDNDLALLVLLDDVIR